MKTIKELNSKWYWRLIKVIYIFLIGVIFIASVIGIFYEFHTYNPNKIENIISEITQQQERLNNKINDLKSTFPNQHYTLSEIKKIIKNHKGGNGLLDFSNNDQLYLSMHFLLSFGKDIDNIEKCLYKGCGTSDDIVYQTLYEQKYSDTLYLYEEDIKLFSSTVENRNTDYKNMKDNLSECLRKLSSYCYIQNQDNFKKNYDIDTDIGYSSDYISFLGWVKVIFSGIGVLLLISIFIYIIRGITYYIILGKFSPDE